ncbi:hypothetical protein [Dyadobacter sp. MSC1_007]|jgi:hypothetical protein|uniref:hypothetical protein n=1 Tax=Dyadobacter sp. MSC1_007 TaxID=2909264 RepID=UPI00202F8FDF|nr:hypothetical protein [Dyadobacter sp. MSC1_007]
MNQKNFEYLQDQLTFNGFGAGLSERLLTAMQSQIPEFSLPYQVRFGKDELRASLNFQKSAHQDLYFFKSYLASLKNHGQSQRINQLFYIQPSGSINLKEAFNLLQGRAVEKQLLDQQGDPYHAWLQLDFKNSDAAGNFKIKQFTQDYGYDLGRALSKLSLKELSNDESKARLLDSLRGGNRQQVTLLYEGQQHKFFIEASPQFKGIIAYNQHSVRQQIQSATSLQQQRQQPGLLTDQSQRLASQREQGLLPN